MSVNLGVVVSLGKIGNSLGNSSRVMSVIDSVVGDSEVEVDKVEVDKVEDSSEVISQAGYLQLADSFSSPTQLPPFLK